MSEAPKVRYVVAWFDASQSAAPVSVACNGTLVLEDGLRSGARPKKKANRESGKRR